MDKHERQMQWALDGLADRPSTRTMLAVLEAAHDAGKVDALAAIHTLRTEAVYGDPEVVGRIVSFGKKLHSKLSRIIDADDPQDKHNLATELASDCAEALQLWEDMYQ